MGTLLQVFQNCLTSNNPSVTLTALDSVLAILPLCHSGSMVQHVQQSYQTQQQSCHAHSTLSCLRKPLSSVHYIV